MQENWIQFRGENIAESQLTLVDNPFPLGSSEHSALAFAQLWLSNQKIFNQNSSGSTGSPTKHQILRSQMQASASGTINTLGIKAGDTALLCISADFIGGKMMIVRALEHKLNLIVGEVSANPLISIPSRNPIDFYSFVPYQIQKILESANEEQLLLLNKSKAIILGGAPVSAHLAECIKKHLTAPVFSTYGMTETVSHVALKRINGKQDVYFSALEGVSFSQDMRNCLIIHAPEITGREALITNDMVKLIDKHHFEWLGRYDFVINSGGIKLHPEQIELQIENLLQLQGIKNAFFVFGQSDENFGAKLCMIMESPFETTQIRDILKNGLTPYEVPKRVYETDSFLKTKSDKLDRKSTLKKTGIDHL